MLFRSLAHARRYLFEALPTAPVEAHRALELILEVYRVERLAKDQGIVGTAEHLALRQTRSRAAMDTLHEFLLEQKGKHQAKSPMHVAVNYALNQWEPLTQFLKDAKIPVDNNDSERALKVVATGRRNFMFVGHAEAGQNIAGIYSLIATCEVNGVDPAAYLADVLLRIDQTPADRLDDLLPQNWKSLSQDSTDMAAGAAIVIDLADDLAAARVRNQRTRAIDLAVDETGDALDPVEEEQVTPKTEHCAKSASGP